ncbi:MAG: ABC transporter permease, partial [Planctomycetota bacterium]|nr:ABC transporter permease [Planctomycetota bacterium]
ATRICIPPLVNQFIMTLKNSSITSLVTITEVVRAGEQIISASFRSFEVYTAVAFCYLVMNSAFMAIANHLERRQARQ